MNGPSATNATDSPREMNWKLLRPYARGLQIAGWAMVAAFVCRCIGRGFDRFLVFDGYTPFGVLLSAGIGLECREVLFPGLVILVVAHLMRWLGDHERGPSMLLRHGHWVFFFYGAVLLVFLTESVYGWASPSESGAIAVGIVKWFVPTAIEALVYFAIGLALRRLVLAIEATKAPV